MNIISLKSLAAAVAITGATLPQFASASSFYDSGIDFSYTITANNRNAGGDLQGLSISDTFFSDTTGASPSSTSTASYQAFSGLGVAHNVSLQAGDSVPLGLAISDYFSELMISFQNLSANVNDIFDVKIAFNYTLSAETGGEFADTDVSFAYSNEDYSFDHTAFVNASVVDSIAQSMGFGSFGFVLSAGQSENIYFDSTVTSQLEATVVPVPAAIWLFGGGLAGLLGSQRRSSVKTAEA